MLKKSFGNVNYERLKSTGWEMILGYIYGSDKKPARVIYQVFMK